MSQRKLYPPGKLDRRVLWGGSIFMVVAYCTFFWWISGKLFWFDGIALAAGLLALWALIYLKQDQPKDKFEKYTIVISNIESIGKQLTETVDFLREEQQKVLESEATLRKLNEEKTQLEPVVTAQRATVNAILTAHGRATASRAWKERLLGFISGLFASLIAAMLFEYFRR